MLSRIKKGDTVQVISGKDKGKQGAVLSINKKKDTILVKGVCIVSRHVKASRSGEKSKIVKEEIAIKACKVMPVNPTTKKPCRIQTKVLEDGSKVRMCAKTKELF